MQRVVALGFFDGVHLGHGALLKKTKQRAEELHATSTAVSFDVHPDTVIFHEEVPLLGETVLRKDLIERLYGIDEVIFLPFDNTVKDIPWEDFLNRLVSDFRIIWIVCGYDYTFGAKGQGNVDRLKEYCDSHAIGYDIVPQVRLDGEVVSSTAIRQMLKDGDLEKANTFLGHPHCIAGTVGFGHQLGRTISVPTANLHITPPVITPKTGVYISTVTGEDGVTHPAVTNIGCRPTVGDDNPDITVESHLLDYSGNLYGQPVRVDLHRYLRPEVKFDTMESLKEQIAHDCETTKKYFETTEKT